VLGDLGRLAAVELRRRDAEPLGESLLAGEGQLHPRSGERERDVDRPRIELECAAGQLRELGVGELLVEQLPNCSSVSSGSTRQARRIGG
jgi:hypothetical protein